MKLPRPRGSRQGRLPDPSASEVFRRLERELLSRGVSLLAGIDEAGRGCLAGPVVAAAVILPPEVQIPGIRDSKLLSPLQRERLFDQILEKAVAHGIGQVAAPEIDRINILQASLLAMRIAVEALAVVPGHLLIDGPQRIRSSLPQTPVVRGDRTCFLIAAASILAKVTRDRLMCDAERAYPHFRFSGHKGYGTAAHLAELRAHGPTPLHRRTFKGVLP